jgi:hypothetical protein
MAQHIPTVIKEQTAIYEYVSQNVARMKLPYYSLEKKVQGLYKEFITMLLRERFSVKM